MPSKPDPEYLYKAMRTVGLDPADDNQVQYFMGLVMKQVDRLNDTQRAHLTDKRWRELMDLAADEAHNTQLMPAVEQMGLGNSPAHLWDLTEHGAAGRARREQTRRAVAQNTRLATDPGDNFAPEGTRGVSDTFTQDQPTQPADKFKPLSNDPDELWKQSRQKGQV